MEVYRTQFEQLHSRHVATSTPQPTDPFTFIPRPLTPARHPTSRNRHSVGRKSEGRADRTGSCGRCVKCMPISVLQRERPHQLGNFKRQSLLSFMKKVVAECIRARVGPTLEFTTLGAQCRFRAGASAADMILQHAHLPREVGVVSENYTGAFSTCGKPVNSYRAISSEKV